MTKKVPTIRDHRKQQLVGAGSYAYSTWFLFGLIQSARLLLLTARDERKSNGPSNHLTQHGPAAILVAFTALECFVNQLLQQCFILSNRTAFEQLLDDDLFIKKLKQIPKLIRGSALVTTNIELVQHVRNEIIHHHPRDVGPTGVPQWLIPLAKAGLLYTVGNAPNDIGWQQKLQSFQLASWCADTVRLTAHEFVTSLRGNQHNQPDLTSAIVDSMEIGATYFEELHI